MRTHDRLQVLIPAVVWWSPACLLLLMTVLSTQLSSSAPSFMELLMLSKQQQQSEADMSNYKVSWTCVRALWLSLSLMLHSTALWSFCELATEITGSVSFDFTLKKSHLISSGWNLKFLTTAKCYKMCLKILMSSPQHLLIVM